MAAPTDIKPFEGFLDRSLESGCLRLAVINGEGLGLDLRRREQGRKEDERRMSIFYRCDGWMPP